MIFQKWAFRMQGIHSEDRVLISTFAHISLRGDLSLDLIFQGNKMSFWVWEALSV